MLAKFKIVDFMQKIRGNIFKPKSLTKKHGVVSSTARRSYSQTINIT